MFLMLVEYGIIEEGNPYDEEYFEDLEALDDL